MTELCQNLRRSDRGALAMAVLGPLLLVQARQAVRRAPRLAAASGPVHGIAGQAEPARRLLVIGESTAAGVGARTHAQALPGFLAADLSGRLGGTVNWLARGKGGATARRGARRAGPGRNGALRRDRPDRRDQRFVRSPGAAAMGG